MGGLLSVLLRSCRLLVRQKKPFSEEPVTPAGNPLPSVIHKVIQHDDLGPGRLVLVGDVHGCLDELNELLDKLEFRHGHDNLVLVGDLVNKGPKSQQVVAAVRGWCQQGNAWVVRGNHDDSALAARLYLHQGLSKGLNPELKPKHHWVGTMLEEDEQFMTELPFSLEIKGYNILVVHAGLVPDVPLQQQELATLTKMRDVVQGPGGSWYGLEKPQEGSQAWATAWPGPQHVFFGHDAKRRLQDCPYATGLDTGCVYGGQLTACVLPPLAELQCSAAEGGRAVAVAQGVGLQEGGAGGSTPASNGGARASVSRHRHATLDDLQGRFVSVDGQVAYEQPGRRSVGGAHHT